MKNKLAPLFVLVAAILWGTTGTARTFAPDYAGSISIGIVRLALCGFTLLVVAALMKKIRFTGWPIHLLLSASLAMALFQPFFFSAVELSGVAVGTVVSIGSAPVFSGVIEWLYYKTAPSKTWWISTGLAISGSMILMAGTDTVTIDPVGVLSGLGAGVSMAIFTMTNSRMVHYQHPVANVAVVFSLSTLMLSPFLFWTSTSWLLETNGLLSALFIGLIATALAYYLFAVGLRNVKASTALTLVLAEPLTASLLGVFMVGEVLDTASWVGLIMLLSGLIIIAVQSVRKPSKYEHQHEK